MYVLPEDLQRKSDVAREYLYMNDEYEWVWEEGTSEEVKKGWEEFVEYDKKMGFVFNGNW